MDSPISTSRRMQGPGPTPIADRGGDKLADTFNRGLDIVEPTEDAGGTASPTPFQITNQSTGGATPAAYIGVNYGLLYQPQLGTNIDVTLDGTSLTLAPTHNFTSAGTYAIYLEVDLSGNTASIQTTTGTVPSDDPSSYLTYLILGIVTVATSGSGLTVTQIQQAITSSLVVTLCSGSSTFFWSSV
jgi:hypothetical protein